MKSHSPLESADNLHFDEDQLPYSQSGRIFFSGRILNEGTFEPQPFGSDEEFMAHFARVRPLVEGGQGEILFGVVQTQPSGAMHKLEVGDEVAIKRINLEAATEMRVQNEMLLLSELDHPGVLKLLGAAETPNGVFLVTKFFQGGDLHSFLGRYGRLTERQAARIFHMLVASVLYLHENSVVHRDIKLENVLLSSEGSSGKSERPAGIDNAVPVLCDLGMSSLYSDDKDKCKTARLGSTYYAAPELLKEKCRYQGPEVDVWGLGVVLYALLTGTLPFFSNNEQGLYRLILRCEYAPLPESISASAASLFHGLCEPDVGRRLTLREAMMHPWLASRGMRGARALEQNTLRVASLVNQTPGQRAEDFDCRGLFLSDFVRRLPLEFSEWSVGETCIWLLAQGLGALQYNFLWRRIDGAAMAGVQSFRQAVHLLGGDASVAEKLWGLLLTLHENRSARLARAPVLRLLVDGRREELQFDLPQDLRVTRARVWELVTRDIPGMEEDVAAGRFLLRTGDGGQEIRTSKELRRHLRGSTPDCVLIASRQRLSPNEAARLLRDGGCETDNFDGLLVATCVLRAKDSVMLYVNDSFAQLFGYPASHLIGFHIERLLPSSLIDVHNDLVSGYRPNKPSRVVVDPNAPQSAARRRPREVVGVHADGRAVHLQLTIHVHNPGSSSDEIFFVGNMCGTGQRTEPPVSPVLMPTPGSPLLMPSPSRFSASTSEGGPASPPVSPVVGRYSRLRTMTTEGGSVPLTPSPPPLSSSPSSSASVSSSSLRTSESLFSEDLGLIKAHLALIEPIIKSSYCPMAIVQTAPPGALPPPPLQPGEQVAGAETDFGGLHPVCALNKAFAAFVGHNSKRAALAGNSIWSILKWGMVERNSLQEIQATIFSACHSINFLTKRSPFVCKHSFAWRHGQEFVSLVKLRVTLHPFESPATAERHSFLIFSFAEKKSDE